LGDQLNCSIYFYYILVAFLLWDGLGCNLAPGSKIGNYSKMEG